MKNITIPAQITTVEDRIVGNLTLGQLFLLAAPIFIDFVIYAAMPKSMHLYLYKLFLIILISSLMFVLAVRIKGKLILFWTITLVGFKFRNKIHVFNKNNLSFRTIETNTNVNDKEAENNVSIPIPKTRKIPESEISLSGLSKSLSFIEERRGRLYVYVSEDH